METATKAANSYSQSPSSLRIRQDNSSTETSIYSLIQSLVSCFFELGGLKCQCMRNTVQGYVHRILVLAHSRLKCWIQYPDNP